MLECFITSSEGGGLSTEDHHLKCAWELWSLHYSMSRVYVLVGTLGRSCVFLKHLWEERKSSREAMPGLREEGTEPHMVLLRQVGRRVLGTVLVGGTWLSGPSGPGGQWG